MLLWPCKLNTASLTFSGSYLRRGDQFIIIVVVLLLPWPRVLTPHNVRLLDVIPSEDRFIIVVVVFLLPRTSSLNSASRKLPRSYIVSGFIVGRLGVALDCKYFVRMPSVSRLLSCKFLCVCVNVNVYMRVCGSVRACASH